MTENERKAQCAWLCYVSERLDSGTASHETFTQWLVACKALTLPEKDAHDAWRGKVTAALQETVQSFCPGGECCDPKFWKGGKLENIHKGPVTP